MKLNRIGMVVTLGLALMGCEAEDSQSRSTQAQTVAAQPAETVSQNQSQTARSPAHDAAGLEHQHDDMHSMLRLDDGQRWTPDAPLVQGMERIRSAVNDAAARPELDADAAEALAQSVQEQVNFLIANCRLEPDADATLHVFIAQLLQATTALQEDPSSSLGIPQMQQTLREYPRYFAHPGWEQETVTAR